MWVTCLAADGIQLRSALCLLSAAAGPHLRTASSTPLLREPVPRSHRLVNFTAIVLCRRCPSALMLCCSSAVAPGAAKLSLLLRALQLSHQQAWMFMQSTSSAAVVSADEGELDGSKSVEQVPVAAVAQQHQHSQPLHQLQLEQQQHRRQPSIPNKQFLYQLPAPGQQLPKQPRFLPQQGPQPLPALTALQIVKANARAKFPETVEAHIRLKVDPRRGDQMVRGAAVLPYSLGKPVKIAVFAQGPDADAAREAGADIIGSDALIAEILESKGKSLKFNSCLATPDMMPKLVKLGRILGPKGLMPNPKMGTLTSNVPAAVAELRKGRVDFRMDRTAIVHAPLGKVAFDVNKLYANIGALTAALLAVKPEAVKGGLPKYVMSVHVCSSMGRAVPVEVSSLLSAMDVAAATLGKQAEQRENER